MIAGDNMKNKKWKLLLFICSLCISSGCTQKQNLEKHSMTATNLGFDTVISFTAYTKNEKEFKKYENELSKQISYYNKIFDCYNSYEGINNIKTINDNAGKKPVEVNEDIIDLLTISKEYAELTNGKFDITLGSVMDLWREAREQAEKNPDNTFVPSMEDLENAKEHSGWDKVQIDKEKNTVYLTDPKTRLDVGAIAKGYAIDKTSQHLKELGVEHGFLNGGGNIRLLGNKPDDSNWVVGVQIPDLTQQATDSISSLSLPGNTSIVTSGDYQRFYVYDGTIMHHIIDPETLQPARYARSVSIVCDDGTASDILSTALFTMSQEDGQALLDKINKEKDIHASALWVYDKNTLPKHLENSYKNQEYTISYSPSLKEKIVK